MQYSQIFFIYAMCIKICDALTVILAWYLTWFLRFESQVFPITKGLPEFHKYRAIALPLALIFSTVLHIVGTYRANRIMFGFRPLKKLVQGSILSTLVFVSLLYFADAVNYSRIFLVVFVAVVVALLFLERALLALGWKFAYRKWTRPIRVLLVGSGDLMDMYVRKLHSVQPYPIRWVGRVGEKRSPVLDSWIPFLGDESRLSNVIEKESIDQVVVSYAPEVNTKYPSVLDSLSKEVVSVKVLPNFGRESSFTYHATDECGFPLLMFNQPPASVTDRFFKRAFDLFGAFVLLILFSPLLLLIALLIKLTSKGPAIYSQLRIGADGKEFIFYKFRSMKIEAEEETGPVWATKNDTRTTRLGQFLRRTSLDELPQLYNVLIGDMSLVGPRPERPVFVKQFRENIPKYMLRHRMKSGMTGWAQINGWRGDTSIEERIKHDLYYIGHWSHYFDIKILVLTAFKGFIHRNAY